MTVNEAIRDSEISHAVDLEQYKSGVVHRIIALLNRSDADLAERLRVALERSSVLAVEHIEALLGQVRSLNVQAYQLVGRELTEELQRFAEQEALYQSELVASAFDGVDVSFTRITGGQVYAAAYSQPFRGRLLSEWALSIEADRMVRIRDSVRLGIVEQLTTQQIVQRVRGTRAKGYKDGIIEIDRRNATAVVRTAVSHVAGMARDTFHRENGDLIKAVEWTSTLDARTSSECRIRDGLKYTAATHKPIDHKVPWLSGPGRLHWNCRSCSIPVLKSWRELGVDIDEMSPSTRASMDGQVPAGQTYSEWFKRQPASRQDEIVGPTRGALMRSGGLPFDSLYTNRGEYLTLEQLAERNALAFRRAKVRG